MMKEGGQNSFRFSLSWPRIILDKEGTVNPKGLQFYHDLIDECLRQGIEPFCDDLSLGSATVSGSRRRPGRTGNLRCIQCIMHVWS